MRVVIADSNDLVRIGLRTLISAETEAEIVGEAQCSDDLLEMISNFKVDVVLIDFTNGGFSIDVIHQVNRFSKDIQLLAITPEQSAQTLVDALRSGITSYVKKDCSSSEIIEAIKETHKGNKFFCGQILETIQEANLNVDDIEIGEFTCEPVVISTREQEIIIMISEGYTNAQIAEKLFLSAHTIGTHRKNIMSKLGVKNTAGIVMYAIKAQLVSPNKFLFTSTN